MAGGAAEQPAGSARAHARLGVSACGRSRGGQEGPDTSCAVATVSARVWHPVSRVRCERSVVHGVCPSDRCPVRASERPGVHCPASASSVRCPCVAASAVSNAKEVAGVAWAGSRMAGWPGAGVVACRVHDGASSAEVRAWPSKLAQAVLGQRRVDLDLVVVVGGGWQWGQVDRVADPDRLDACEHRPSVGSWR